jgi:hypothetical protein
MSVLRNQTGIRGLDQVIDRLNVAIEKIKGASYLGLIEAASVIRYDMDTTPPLIPVKIGNLRSSWTVEPHKASSPTRPAIVLGFTASYAWYVHEMLSPAINWTRPGSGPKFFEAALKRNEGRILGIIAKHARVR